jgi:hypothetical protein
VRDRRFRYDYGELARARAMTTEQYVIWSDFAHTRSWWSVTSTFTDENDLGSALAAAAGVSGGSSTAIAGLLMRDHISSWLSQVKAPTFVADEDVGGDTCWRIEATSRSGDPVTLWIEHDSYLIRQLVTEHHLADFDTKTTYTFLATVDKPIDVDTLTPGPPKPPPSMPSIGVKLATPAARQTL